MLTNLTKRWSGLLVLLVLAMLLGTQMHNSFALEMLVLALLAASFAGSVLLSEPSTRWRRISLASTGLWYAVNLATLLGAPLDVLTVVLTSLVLICALVATFRALVMASNTNVETLLAAVYGYHLLILAWTVLYLQIEKWAPGSFNLAEGANLWSTLLFFSVVTMTTLGYGDVLPVGDFARMAAGFEAIFGVLYIAVMIGGIVGSMKSSRSE